MNKIVLFDVDQTLLYSGGAGSLAMKRAFAQLYGVEDGFRQVEFSGRTDWAILRAAMQHHGVLDGNLHGDAFWDEMTRFRKTYYELLPLTLNEVEGGKVLPGVPELLEALSTREGVRLGMATGNFREAAFMKLRHFGIDGYLFEGGFGNDAEDRRHVVGTAIERVASGWKVESGSVWVIGDTPLDVDAAHANGARALGVATGPLGVEELLEQGADVAVADLSDTPRVIEVVLDSRASL